MRINTRRPVTIPRWWPVVLAVTCFVPTLHVSVGAQEWTRFRGPNGQGKSSATTIPVTFAPKHFLWKTRLPGLGHSSPVVWGKKAFLLSADPESATRYLLCLNIDSGAMVWQKSFPSKSHHLHLRNSYASSTPAVDAERVYVAWSTPDQLLLKAFDHEGAEVWSRDLGPWTSQHGFGTSPMRYKDLVILSNSQQADELKTGDRPGVSRMMAFSARTGELRWSTPMGTSRVCYPTPCIYRRNDGPAELVGYNTTDGIFSLDPETGHKNWSLSVFRMRNVNSPTLVGDLILGSNGSGGGGNFLVAVQGGKKPREVYRITRQAPYVPTPITRGELVFLFYDKGIVTCIEGPTGKVVWQERLNTSFSGSPVLVGDKIYCIDDAGVVWVLAAERVFETLARNPLEEASRATPAVADGKMLLRTYTHLMCVSTAR